jgi:hypothetical protein
MQITYAQYGVRQPAFASPLAGLRQLDVAGPDAGSERDELARLRAELDAMRVLRASASARASAANAGLDQTPDIPGAYLAHTDASKNPFATTLPKLPLTRIALDDWATAPSHCAGTIHIGAEEPERGVLNEVLRAMSGGCALALAAVGGIVLLVLSVVLGFVAVCCFLLVRLICR